MLVKTESADMTWVEEVKVMLRGVWGSDEWVAWGWGDGGRLSFSFSQTVSV